MKFTITRKNTNDTFDVSTVRHSNKSHNVIKKDSAARISSADIYKQRIIKFLDSVELSSKRNTVANEFRNYKDLFADTTTFKELSDLVLKVLNKEDISNQPNAKKHVAKVEAMIAKYGEDPHGHINRFAHTDLLKYIWNTMLKADGFGVNDACAKDEDEEEKSKSNLSEKELDALKQLAAKVPELLALLKDKDEDDVDKEEDNANKDEPSEESNESVLLDPDKDESNDKNNDKDNTEDDEDADEDDIISDSDSNNFQDAAVSIENKSIVDKDFEKDQEICDYFNRYYAEQLKK